MQSQISTTPHGRRSLTLAHAVERRTIALSRPAKGAPWRVRLGAPITGPSSPCRCTPQSSRRHKKLFSTPYLFAPCCAYSCGRPNDRRQMIEQQLNT